MYERCGVGGGGAGGGACQAGNGAVATFTVRDVR